MSENIRTSKNDTDLATLRNAASHGVSEGFYEREDVDGAYKRVEAELSRLRQTLERTRENAKAWHGPDGLRTGHAHALAVIAQWCDDALAGPDTPACDHEWVQEHGTSSRYCLLCGAGPDTPADSHSWNQPLAKLEDGKWVDPFVPADDEPCSCCDGEGCAYCTPDDSPEEK
jgi:hypothetical protein